MSDPNTTGEDLLSQLKNSNFFQDAIKEQAQPVPTLTEDNAVEYVIQQTGKVIDQSVDLLETLKNKVEATGDAEEVASYAGLVGSISSAIDNLNKLIVTNKKIKGAKEIKKMEIDAKKELQENETKNNVFLGSREEIIKLLMKEADVIDVKNVTEPPKEPSHLMPPSSENQTDSLKSLEKH
jgi:DNA-binding protein